MTDDPRDLARYLPLSTRPRVDESAVSGDWRPRLDELAAAIESDSPRGDRTAFDHVVARARARRRVRVGDLGAALVAAYELSDWIVVDPVTTGAVCLARSLSAPLPIRAVVRGRTLHAIDADWRLGSGAELAGTARELVLFLYGRGPVPGS